MNLRKTAIALAVAGTTVAAPVASFAADEVFASARIGLWNKDTGGVSDFAVRSFSSRFGAAGETDLGNGLTGYGRYEWDVDFNADDDADGGCYNNSRNYSSWQAVKTTSVFVSVGLD